MKYTIGLNDSCFEIHAAGCRDLDRKTPSARLRFAQFTGEPWTVERESGQAALDAELNEDFSSESEHPAQDGFAGGTFGAAGFYGRIFPCATKARG